MNLFSNLDPFWADRAAFALILCGLMIVGRGLRSGRDGARSLLRRQTDMLGRIEGFRLTVCGLVLVGVGAAVFWQAQWLLVLALGIGFVEILESSTLIAFWKGGRVIGDGMKDTHHPHPRRWPPRLRWSRPGPHRARRRWRCPALQ